MNKETKLIKISKNTHEKLKQFCEKNALVMSKWVDIVILKEIKYNEENNDNLQNDESN